jgi:hypothetical protein
MVLAAAAALGICRSVSAAIGLPPGEPVSFDMPPSSVTLSYYVDVPETVPGELTIALEASGNSDIDVVVRYGTPFADAWLPGGAIDYELLLRYAQYLGASPEPEETIHITRASTQPLRGGRWYLAVVNSSQQPTRATLTASLSANASNAGIQVDFGSASSDCDLAPWNDATPAVPVGGNQGTTLGQQRRNALLHATELLSGQIRSPVPITLQACWEHQGGSSTRATLANAHPTAIMRGDIDFAAPWLPLRYTWYTVAATTRLAGTRACALLAGPCNEPDIVATFNSDIGTPGVLGGSPFYLGLEPGTGSGVADFVSVAMHELGHGLGFLGLVNLDADRAAVGARFSGRGASSYEPPGYDDAYSAHAAIVPLPAEDGLYVPFLSPDASDADRADALVSVSGLRWLGEAAVESPLNPNPGPVPLSFPRLYAPCAENRVPSAACATEPGSTLSHLDQPGELMNAFYTGTARSLGLAAPMLAAVGWDNAPAAVPQYGRPMPSNWNDPAHSGHGIDLRRVIADPELGDVYYVVFYTYDSAGKPDVFTSVGRLVDGVFVSGPDAHGHSLQHVRYDPVNQRPVLDPTTGGHLAIDFNQASAAPACRERDRSGAAQLAVMDWSIDGTGAQWCMQPIVSTAQHPQPDFNGLWYGGSADSGWGVSILDVDQSPARSHLTTVIYYPDAQGALRWAIGENGAFESGTPFPLLAFDGYCRTCAPVAPTSRPIGSITLELAQATMEPPGAPLSGTNRISVDIEAGTGNQRFIRRNIPFTMESIPEVTD